MAGVRGKVTVANVASGTSAKTVLQLVAPADHRVLLKGFSATFKGATSSAVPVRVELVRQSTAGTSTAATPVKNNPADDETLQTTARHTATVEPTTTDVVRSLNVHPQSGYCEWLPLGEEIAIPGGTRLGLRVTAAADVNLDAEMSFEE